MSLQITDSAEQQTNPEATIHADHESENVQDRAAGAGSREGTALMSEESKGPFQNTQHLLRMAGIFAVGILLFVVARALLVPEGFGKYGHYRAPAIDDNAAKPLSFAGRAACAECHADIVEARAASKHARIGCEACHGALSKHAADPTKAKATKPVAKTLCPVCHELNVARPKTIKQVNSAEHSGGEACDSCHAPHAPEL